MFQFRSLNCSGDTFEKGKFITVITRCMSEKSMLRKVSNYLPAMKASVAAASLASILRNSLYL